MTLDDFDTLVARVSKRAFCSGWQAEIEFELWLITIGVSEPRLGQTVITGDELRQLREHLSTGTWISWSGRPVLVPLPEWLAAFDRLRGVPSSRWLFATDHLNRE